jgi:hypothetical protein
MSVGLRKKIIEALDSLGNTPDKIADALRAAGIKSRGCSGWDCPLHDYLMLKLKDENLTKEDIYIGTSWVAYHASSDIGTVDLSEAHREFINRVDRREWYQDLLVTS